MLPVMGTPSRTLNVIATTERGTLAALQHAAALARSTRAGVTILVPHVLGYGAPLDRQAIANDIGDIAASYRDLAARVGLDAAIRICPCREPRHMVGRLMLENARLVLAGRWRQWLATAEQRLARELACDGHDVIFVDIATGLVREEGIPGVLGAPRVVSV
jgi:hypothetical protein